MDNLMKHLRSIHYFLVISCGTLLYVALIAGVYYPVLIADLDKFARYVTKLNFDADKPNTYPSLAQVNATYFKDYVQKITRQLEFQNSPNTLNWDEAMFKQIYIPKNFTTTTYSEEMSLEELMANIKSYQMEAFVLTDLVEGQVNDWPKYHDEKVINIKSVKTSKVRGDTVDLYLDIEIPDERGAGRSWTHTANVSVSFHSRLDTIRYSETWFNENHETLVKYFDKYSWYSPKNLKDYAKFKMGDDINEKLPDAAPVKLLGVKIQGEHVGFLGTVIIMITMVYLLIYIQELRRVWTSDVEKPAAMLWVGMIPNKAAKIFLFFQLRGASVTYG